MIYTTTNNISLDFYNNNMVIVNAKQYDTASRNIVVTCTDSGKTVQLDWTTMSAYTRCTKPDGNYILNKAAINPSGQVQIPLTQQMLAAVGKVTVDVMIFATNNIKIDNLSDLNDINSLYRQKEVTVISTMTFYINVVETAANLPTISSSYEYNALIDGITSLITTEDHMKDLDAALNKAETARATAESNRVRAESSRVTAENNRVTAENNRVQAEKNRETKTTEAINKIKVDADEANNQINQNRESTLVQINTAKTNSVNEINSTKNSAINAIVAQKEDSITAIGTEKDNSITAIGTEKNNSIAAINTAKETAVSSATSAINQEKTSALRALDNKEKSSVTEITSTKDTLMNEINAAVEAGKKNLAETGELMTVEEFEALFK
ncbi:hypothetical protein [Faecalibacillus intestinalis]|uniref:hypothetical protein n=1 Tax=Faecalibacillus intestinalis TaxID=1982626 RepID=UPI002E792064|nr:hypothetical protein [Faecalibacillus intestinalis]MEE1445848.1 hypothetical protein [Faecalibacillus intestinalis]